MQFYNLCVGVQTSAQRFVPDKRYLVVIGKFLGGAPDPEKDSYPMYIALVIVALIAFYALGLDGWITFDFIEAK